MVVSASQRHLTQSLTGDITCLEVLSAPARLRQSFPGAYLLLAATVCRQHMFRAAATAAICARACSRGVDMQPIGPAAARHVRSCGAAISTCRRLAGCIQGTLILAIHGEPAGPICTCRFRPCGVAIASSFSCVRCIQPGSVCMAVEDARVAVQLQQRLLLRQQQRGALRQQAQVMHLEEKGKARDMPSRLRRGAASGDVEGGGSLQPHPRQRCIPILRE